MRRKYRIIIILFIFPQILIAQKHLTTFKDGDLKLLNVIDRNLILYHNEEIVLSGKNAIVFCIINISKKGDIKDVYTLNSQENIISKAIKDAVLRTQGNWLEGCQDYFIGIPIYVLNKYDMGKAIIDLKEFLPDNTNAFPLNLIMLKPLVIEIQWKKHQ